MTTFIDISDEALKPTNLPIIRKIIEEAIHEQFKIRSDWERSRQFYATTENLVMLEEAREEIKRVEALIAQLQTDLNEVKNELFN